MKRVFRLFIISLTLSLGQMANAQDTIINLWPNTIPNQVKSNEKEVHDKTDILRISNVQDPSIDVYLPSKKNANGKAMLIFPGGGYGILAYHWEGTDIAKLLNAKGIAGIVVKYRLPNSKTLNNQYDVPLQDAQRAMRIVRSHATEWNIKENKIGIIGFSAGGSLASTLGTHYDDEVYQKQDSLDDLSARPDFMALIYPVISMTEGVTHQGSKDNLLGKNPSQELVDRFSNELHVTEDTPPTFLVHAEDDTAVPVENSLIFYKALRDKKVPASMHLYPTGGHGFSLALKENYLGDWPRQLILWTESL